MTGEHQPAPSDAPESAAADKPAWPAYQVERRAISTLQPYPRNARTHSAEQIAQIAASISEWGWTIPVLIDESDEIIAGHARVQAARWLGLAEVPVVVARGWTEMQKRAYVIADNKLTLNAGWDDALLASELKALAGEGFDLDLTGFESGEVDELFAKAALKAGLSDPDAVLEPPAKPFTKSGDVWQLGRHRLACGDCTDAPTVERCFAGAAQPLLMVTDPPYGVDYNPTWRAKAGVNINTGKMGKVLNDDRADWREAWALFEGDVAYVWHAGRFANVVADSLLACDFELRAQIIWSKDRFALSRGDYHWKHEPCWYVVRKGRPGHWASDRSQTTVWEIAARDDSGLGHGTQKPVEAMLRPMLNNSHAGEAVYDPFVGSGTTLIAAEMSGRRCYAIELDPAYCDVVIQRWQDFTGEQALREGDGARFVAPAKASAASESAA
jgi:DNA modification methylase